MSLNSKNQPKFTTRTAIESKSGKIGALLDWHGDVPTYNTEINEWLYPWSYGLGGTSSGSIPENYIQKYLDKDTKKWIEMSDWTDKTCGGSDNDVQ